MALETPDVFNSFHYSLEQSKKAQDNLTQTFSSFYLKTGIFIEITAPLTFIECLWDAPSSMILDISLTIVFTCMFS